MLLFYGSLENDMYIKEEIHKVLGSLMVKVKFNDIVMKLESMPCNEIVKKLWKWNTLFVKLNARLA